MVEHYKQNRSDEAEPSSPAPGQGIPVTDGTTSEQTDGQQEDESTDHETLSSSGDLQTMTYPLTEAEEAPQSPGTNTARRLKSNQSHASRASANTRQGASSSYFTAREYNPDDPDAGQRPASEGAPEQQPRNPSQSLKLASLQGLSQQSSTPSTSEPESTQELLKRRKRPQPKPQRSDFTSGTLDQQEPQGEESGGTEGANNGRPARTRFVRNKAAKYNLDDNLLDKRQRLGARVARAHGGISAIRPRRRKAQEGEIVKAERMLVRVEVTMQRDLPEDYTENDSLRMESRLVDNWREFLMVCRKISDEHAPFALQMYRTRVIPEAEKPGTRTKPRYEIQLSRKGARANLYSSLDKSLVIWGPCKAGTNIYIVRPKSSAHATEWYTFISQVLGWSRPSSLQINVPDLGVSLIFKNPFGKTPNFESEDSGEEESGLFSQAAPDEYAATAIIRGCLEMLENRAEWSEVLKEWSKTERMGLAWKRYDRLEWIFGANEKKMYGSIAMATSHELELRPRRHYPTGLKHEGTKLEEPQPVEGFLVRLTSQRGVHQRMNMVFFKRLYFFTQNHYLLFSRPAKCIPPAPPKMAMEENVPSARELLNRMPISYNIDPYPIQDGEVSWLTNGNKAFIKKQDEYAYMQVRRNIHNLTQADGYIDLCRVREVRQVQRGSSPADANIQEGSDVEFNNDSRDTRRDDGTTGQFDDDRTFEMALDNGLVVRLQSYDKDTRDEWIKRLGALVEYWRARCAADAAELKATRQRNVDLLEIDEEMESMVGQFARKWEVKRAEASPHLHNMCNLLGCRTIKVGESPVSMDDD